MADEPSTRDDGVDADDDDDDGAPPPGVTAPPWLRGGPAADRAVPFPAPAGSPAPERGPADTRQAAPNRIRLGAGRAPEGPVERPGGPRRPADDLSTLPLASGPTGSSSPAGPPGPGHNPARDGRSRRIGLLALAGVAVLAGSAAVGYVITRGAVAPTGEQAGGCVASSEPGRAVGDGPGSLDSPLGAVLAFDHAYYVERSAGKAFEAVSPSSRMTEQQLRADGVDRVPVGTTHCVDVRELAPTLLEVTLTETAPDTGPVVIRQRVRVAENPDGTWGIVTITPAG